MVIASDMQTFASARASGPSSVRCSGVAVDAVPRSVPVYGFNLGGYRATVVDAGHANRHEFGGLNDATFTMLDLLERRTPAVWPF